MDRRFAMTALLTVCLLLPAVSPAPAAEDVLALVSDSASAVVLISHVDAKLQALIDSLVK